MGGFHPTYKSWDDPPSLGWFFNESNVPLAWEGDGLGDGAFCENETPQHHHDVETWYIAGFEVVVWGILRIWWDQLDPICDEQFFLKMDLGSTHVFLLKIFFPIFSKVMLN